MISLDDYLFFVDDALDGMARIVEEMGDEEANRRPELPDSNSPYAILTHCLGVMEYWGGYLVAGRPVERDRQAEFAATGSVVDLLGRVHLVREQFGRDVATAEPDAPLRGALPAGWTRRIGPFVERQGAALMHVYEELAQHRGQMEGCRDVLRASGPATGPA